MLSLKDFKQGQTVYALRTERDREMHHTIKKYIVKSVGRKYVKVAEERFSLT